MAYNNEPVNSTSSPVLVKDPIKGVIEAPLEDQSRILADIERKKAEAAAARNAAAREQAKINSPIKVSDVVE